MKTDAALRKDLRVLLRGGRAHVSYDKAVADLPEDFRGKKPRGAPYSPWQQVEHIRLSQWDILEYIRNPKYKALKWPEEYWPKEAAPLSAGAWEKSLRGYRADLRVLENIVADPSMDLLAPLPHDPEATTLHELLLIADHTAYHLGQLIVLRRLIGAWKD